MRRLPLKVLVIVAATAVPQGSMSALQTTQSYTIPTAYSVTARMVVKDDSIWFVESNTNKIGSFTGGTFREFDIPTTRSNPSDIAVGANGMLWYTQQDANQIGRFDPATVVFKEYDIPTVESLPSRITTDDQGNLWFTEHYGNRVARFEVASETFTEFPIPTPSSRPSGIAVDSIGQVWFLETQGNKLGLLTPAEGTITEFDLPVDLAAPIDLVIDQAGVIWFGGRRNGKLIFYEPTGGTFGIHDIPGGGAIAGITVHKTGRVLFALENLGKIGIFDPSTGKFKIIKAVLEESKPYDIETDDEGNIWFADMLKNALCKLDGQVLSLLY